MFIIFKWKYETHRSTEEILIDDTEAKIYPRDINYRLIEHVSMFLQKSRTYCTAAEKPYSTSINKTIRVTSCYAFLVLPLTIFTEDGQ